MKKKYFNSRYWGIVEAEFIGSLEMDQQGRYFIPSKAYRIVSPEVPELYSWSSPENLFEIDSAYEPTILSKQGKFFLAMIQHLPSEWHRIGFLNMARQCPDKLLTHFVGNNYVIAVKSLQDLNENGLRLLLDDFEKEIKKVIDGNIQQNLRVAISILKKQLDEIQSPSSKLENQYNSNGLFAYNEKPSLRTDSEGRMMFRI
jgi:hypothetical protein